jgi:hypothetical protein
METSLHPAGIDQARPPRPSTIRLWMVSAVWLCCYITPLLVRGGSLGVDIFFTLSGFVITRLLRGERTVSTALTFALHRMLFQLSQPSEVENQHTFLLPIKSDIGPLLPRRRFR